MGTHSTAHMNLHLPRNSKTTVQNPICAIIHINHVVWSLNRSPEAGWSISCIFLIIWQSEATKLLLLPKGSLKYRYQLKCVHFSTAQDNKNKDFEGKKKTDSQFAWVNGARAQRKLQHCKYKPSSYRTCSFHASLSKMRQLPEKCYSLNVQFHL